jgi:hypothetical protein
MELIKSGYSVTLRGPFAQLEVTGTTKELPAEEFRRVDRICKQALIEAKP